jgi:hypothetical protein
MECEGMRMSSETEINSSLPKILGTKKEVPLIIVGRMLFGENPFFTSHLCSVLCYFWGGFGRTPDYCTLYTLFTSSILSALHIRR